MLLVLSLVTGASAGGWAVVTLNDFPDYVVAGKPMSVSFTVRQHGQTLLSGMQPIVSATNSSGLVVKAEAKAARARGEYNAALKFPDAGEWTITIVSGFNDNKITLPVMKVIASGAAVPAAFSPVTRGLRLFAAKGCVGCHRHVEVNPERTPFNQFDLTGKRFAPEYLVKFLADPSIKPAEMPNLNLKQDEIEALAAFINKGGKKQIFAKQGAQ
jgi:mono/diheme cytochrome c family protein